MTAQQLSLWSPVTVESAWCQRWRQRRHSWRHRSEGGFNADRYAVEPLDELAAKRFVLAHHYSASYPAAVRRFGLFDADDLAGVAVFAVPMNTRVISNVFTELVPVREALECSRFVLLDDVAANGESWFLARCFEQLVDVGVHGVVSFADPMLRVDQFGQVVCPGHVGTIYQAANGVHLGFSTPRTNILLPDGTILSARSAQKVRRQERGYQYVVRRLVALGAPRPIPGVELHEWLALALQVIGARRERHPGCHRYAFALGRTPRERRSVRIAGERMPYPKRDLLAA